MRVVLAGLMLAAVLSGCLGGSDKDDGAAVVPTPTGDALNQTSNRTNRAPLANLTSDAGANATAPLNVTFSVTASDADGDRLTWTLTLDNVTIGNGTSASRGSGNGTASTAGNATTGNTTASGNGTASGNATSSGNGTSTTLRQSVTHQFTEAGNYTLVLNVTDGTNSTLANITIRVAAGGATTGAGPVAEDDYVIFNADGTCDAKGEVGAAGQYIHPRGLDAWVYEESNDIAGLQVGGDSEEDAYVDCLNPDAITF